MRLTCPNCDAEYDVPDGMVPAAGRHVQCTSCHTRWFARGTAEAAPSEDQIVTRLEAPRAAPASRSRRGRRAAGRRPTRRPPRRPGRAAAAGRARRAAARCRAPARSPPRRRRRAPRRGSTSTRRRPRCRPAPPPAPAGRFGLGLAVALLLFLLALGAYDLRARSPPRCPPPGRRWTATPRRSTTCATGSSSASRRSARGSTPRSAEAPTACTRPVDRRPRPTPSLPFLVARSAITPPRTQGPPMHDIRLIRDAAARLRRRARPPRPAAGRRRDPRARRDPPRPHRRRRGGAGRAQRGEPRGRCSQGARRRGRVRAAARARRREEGRDRPAGGRGRRRGRRAARRCCSGIPNLPSDDVPDGPDETANVELRRWGARAIRRSSRASTSRCRPRSAGPGLRGRRPALGHRASWC